MEVARDPAHNVSLINGRRSLVDGPEQVDRQQPNQTYNADRVIGNGSFGVVYLANVVETNETVAIKKVFQDKRYKNRELQIMRELNHPNCIAARHAFYTKGEKPDEVYLNVVMDYMPETVYKVLRHFTKSKQSMPILLVKLYAYQLLRALGYLHALGICHRDIKPQNLLVNNETHLLKLCDFGSAKKLIEGEPNVSYICSRYYRAPELIFGATDYTCSIDIWSTGCVIAELMLGKPLFPGESGVDQLVEIIKVLGTPSREQIRRMNQNYTEFRFPQIKSNPWSRTFRPDVPREALAFVSRLVTYCPQDRPKALEALLDPFFDELREEGKTLPNGHPLPELFNWTSLEIESAGQAVISRLTPNWYNRRS